MPVTKKYLNFAAHERYETVTDFSVQKLHKRLCIIAAGNVKLFFLRYVFNSSEERSVCCTVLLTLSASERYTIQAWQRIFVAYAPLILHF